MQNDKENKNGKWVTLKNGRRVFIKEGQSLEEALNEEDEELKERLERIYNSDRFGENEYIILPRKEYAEVCSAIRTKLANKIPDTGKFLYKNHCYCYTYDQEECQFLFFDKAKRGK